MNKFDYAPLVLRAFEALEREIQEAKQITVDRHNELVKADQENIETSEVKNKQEN